MTCTSGTLWSSSTITSEPAGPGRRSAPGAAPARLRRRWRHPDHQRGRDDGAHAAQSFSVPCGATGSPEGRAITTERAPVAR